MNNATLVIKNNREFADDIWQYKAEFTEKQWKETVTGFAEALQNAYDFLDQELFDEEGNDITYPADMLYQIGDVINMLTSIGIRLERSKHEEKI